MNKTLKWILIVLGILLGLALIAAVVFHALGVSRFGYMPYGVDRFDRFGSFDRYYGRMPMMGMFPMLGFGLLRGRSYLQFILSEALPMQPEGWMILTRRLTLAFAVLAVANEVIWRTQSTELWVKLETFAFPIALFLFLMLQIGALSRYVIEPETPPEDGPPRP